MISFTAAMKSLVEIQYPSLQTPLTRFLAARFLMDAKEKDKGFFIPREDFLASMSEIEARKTR
jgi:hypothetical protein